MKFKTRAKVAPAEKRWRLCGRVVRLADAGGHRAGGHRGEAHWACGEPTCPDGVGDPSPERSGGERGWKCAGGLGP